MNKEEMRKARLRALGLEDEAADSAGGSDSESRHTDKKERLSDSAAGATASQGHAAPSAVAGSRDCYPLPASAQADITEILISSNTTPEDMIRWFSQGCQFIDSPKYFLKQMHGGPCGVLAAIQAEMLKSLYFGDGKESASAASSDSTETLIADLSVDRVQHHFTTSLFNIFKRAVSDSDILMIFCELGNISAGVWPQNMHVQRISDEVQFRRFIAEHMPVYESMSGCILLTMSLLLTRGIENVLSDMDDRGNGLIGSFGHCNQELVNLLLTGCATSNVFDGTKPLGDSGLVLKGVQDRSDVGYLTHLESMRYCQVGSFYKNPNYPIWVVGSSSHFTVLFSLDSRVNAETDEEMLLSRVKREFRQADYEENGYIPVDRLGEVLTALSIDVQEMTVEEFNSLKLLLDPESCGIILFGVFWSVVSQLMSGTRIDRLLEAFSSKVGSSAQSSSAMAVDQPLVPTKRERSDSEIARALQDEWNNDSDMSISAPTSLPEPTTAPPATITRSDSDLARALQDEWNTPSIAPSAVTAVAPLSPASAVAPSIGSLDIMSIVSAATAPLPQSVAASQTSIADVPMKSEAPSNPSHQGHDSVADEKSEKFTMHHYNGLSTATSVPAVVTFELQKRAASNDVGQQVAMDTNFGGAYSGMNGCDVEELLKTRWPGCRLHWSGPAPKLD